MAAAADGGIIDSHVHLLQPSQFAYHWLKSESPLNRDFSLADFRAETQKSNVIGGILMEATNTPQEIAWLLKVTEQDSRCWGVIGWIHLEQPDAAAQIKHFAAHPNFKGVRLNWLVSRPNPDRLYAAMQALQAHQLVVDVLARFEYLPEVAALIREFPRLTFVLDHMGGSPLSAATLGAWCSTMRPFVSLPNVMLKVSGYSTETSLRGYLQAAVTCFGAHRLMFGSNYPLCQRYTQTIEILREASDTAWYAALFRENALTTYKLRS